MALRRTPNKVEHALTEMQSGLLHSGSKFGPRVTNPKQAIAIGIHEQQAQPGASLAGSASAMPIRRKLPLPFGT